MSLPTPPVPDPHADPLVASALRAADGGEAGACPDAELVALYAERELDGRAHADVEAHVHGCARCHLPSLNALPLGVVLPIDNGMYASSFFFIFQAHYFLLKL